MEEEKPEQDGLRQVSRLKERLREVNKKLLTMEWDKENNQLNVGMEEVYSELKEERSKLTARINGN